MKAVFGLGLALALLPAVALAQTAAPAPLPIPPNTLKQQSNEYRFQLGTHVDDAKLAKLLPAGWVSNSPAEGLGKGANVRLNFIDSFGITGADGKVIGKGVDRMVVLLVPVKQAVGDLRGQMVLAGITENGAEDAFGILTKATKAKANYSAVTTENGITVRTEDWDFAGADGSIVKMHIKYDAKPGNQGAGNTTRTFDPADPSKFILYQTRSMMDIARNTNGTEPDRVREFSFEVRGGRFAPLFDGSEKPIAWDSLPYYTRSILLPTP